MYLVELDSNGLIQYTGERDGIMAIKEFRLLVQSKGFGIECLTAVSLAADWLSPIRHYSTSDRPKKAMQVVTNSRTAFPWTNQLIQDALLKYQDLQYNPNLVEKERLDDMLIKKLDDIKKSKNSDKQVELFKQLNIIKDLLTKWNKDNEDNNPYSDGPVENGYLLSRLEEKLNDKHSFYNN